MKRVLGRALTKEGGNHNTTEISKNFYQTILNMWNWIVPFIPSKLQHNCGATLGRLRNLTPRKLNKPVFSRVYCLVSCLCVIYCIVQMVQKVDETANSAFVQFLLLYVGSWQLMPPDIPQPAQAYCKTLSLRHSNLHRQVSFTSRRC